MDREKEWPWSEFDKKEENIKPKIKKPIKIEEPPKKDGWFKNILNKLNIVKEPIAIEIPSTETKIISGDDVTYEVPIEATKIVVQITNDSGTIKQIYTLTNYISIKGGDRVRILAT